MSWYSGLGTDMYVHLTGSGSLREMVICNLPMQPISLSDLEKE